MSALAKPDPNHIEPLTTESGFRFTKWEIYLFSRVFIKVYVIQTQYCFKIS